MQKLITLFAVLFSFSTYAQQLKMTDETTDVKYTARYLAGWLEGGFKGVEGTAIFDSSNLSGSYVKLSFKSGTITSNENYLSPNFIKDDCFNPAKFPLIRLTSSSIRKLAAPKAYQFEGELHVKGKVKKISFPMTVVPNAGGYDFSFEFPIRKKAFNLDCGVMGKELKVSVKSYGKRTS